ncbi:hypothetical protein EDD86DRAFT_259273 [Gorgonomyces haynaldii]|nr:hypothetical protein EDD86DRAFT_259273 [Gorgonomyces haynaldii]
MLLFTLVSAQTKLPSNCQLRSSADIFYGENCTYKAPDARFFLTNAGAYFNGCQYIHEVALGLPHNASVDVKGTNVSFFKSRDCTGEMLGTYIVPGFAQITTYDLNKKNTTRFCFSPPIPGLGLIALMYEYNENTLLGPGCPGSGSLQTLPSFLAMLLFLVIN